MTSKHEKDFIFSVIDGEILEKALDWIRINLRPEDVFGDQILEEWAEANYQPPEE